MGKLSDILRSVGQILNAASGNSKDNLFVTAIIAAGGNSTRLGGETTKQMTLLGGLPIVVRTLLVFQAHEKISEIIVSAKEDEIPYYEQFKKEYGITKLVRVVKGGGTRQESVLNAFNAASPSADYVAIHDAARCLLTEDEITKVLDAAIRYGAASAATRAIDTIKIADDKGFIKETVNRQMVWMAKTPQIFLRNLYCAAAYTAQEEGFEATDDNMLVERIKRPVKLVECSQDNLKITTYDDILRASDIIKARENGNVQNR